MNQRKLGLLVGLAASALLLSACATSAPSPLPRPHVSNAANITINLDMDSFNLSSLNPMPTPATLKFTLNLESKAHLAQQALRTKDDLVALWPAQSTQAQPSAATTFYGMCSDH